MAKSKTGDYHDNMDGEGFSWWLLHRLIPAFKFKYGDDMKMILVMDNAPYHHQMSNELYDDDVSVAKATKPTLIQVLIKLGVKEVKIPRQGKFLSFKVPVTEPAEFTAYNADSSKKRKMPKAPADYPIYNNSPKGPSTEELRHATLELVKEKQPSALASKVEAMFVALGWFIIWTPPYCPKFQPIELVWGGGQAARCTAVVQGPHLGHDAEAPPVRLLRRRPKSGNGALGYDERGRLRVDSLRRDGQVDQGGPGTQRRRPHGNHRAPRGLGELDGDDHAVPRRGRPGRGQGHRDHS